MRSLLLVCLCASVIVAAEHRGVVNFNGSPVPGAAVTAEHGGTAHTTTTDARGLYTFPDLAEGPWKLTVKMFGFAAASREVTVPGAAEWELTMLPLEQLRAGSREQKVARVGPAAKPAPVEVAEAAADGLLINGSVNNGAASAFAQAAAFGNNRNAGKGLYTGGLGFQFDNSLFDARPYSLTGQSMNKVAYNRATGTLNFGGPLPRRGPMIYLGYQWTRNRNAVTATGLTPDAALRTGTFNGVVLDPLSGAPFPSNQIPTECISPQARELLKFYPLPNFSSSSRYNYQVPLFTPLHQDALQTRAGRMLGFNNQLSGQLSLMSRRADSSNLFGFLDKTDTLGLDASTNWMHRFHPRLFLNTSARFNRQSTRVTPFFASRENISANTGIAGNNQEPVNWGPPALVFASGISTLTDAQPAFNRDQTATLSTSLLWTHRSHNVTLGGGWRRQQFNVLSQQEPRGTFTFTGALTGSDFADFLLGRPAARSIAYGNADKYLRQSVWDAYITDDWRVRPGLTVGAGLRWEYSTPASERYGRLVNLDIGPGFRTAAPMLTGHEMVRPDRSGISPRIALAWRPLAASSLVVRAGYGIYRDTSVYPALALRMAQQPPLSITSSIQSTAAQPLTLANGFQVAATGTNNTFAIDPAFRLGYAQNWQLSIQRDLPAALVLTGTYLGTKGHARSTGHAAEQLRTRRHSPVRGMPIRLHLSHIKRQFHPPRRAGATAAADAQRPARQRAVHLVEIDRQRRAPRRHRQSRHCAELARPRDRTCAFELRPAPSHRRAGAVLHPHVTRHTAARVDRGHETFRRQRLTANAHPARARAGHRHHRSAASRLRGRHSTRRRILHCARRTLGQCGA